MRGASKILVALALTVALAVPASAGAAGTTGSTTLAIAAAKATLLAQRGVDVSGVGGADTAGRQTRLQISGGSIGADTAELAYEGALRFVAGQGKARRVVRLTALEAQLGGSSVLSAKLNGKKRRTVFDLEAPPGGLAIDDSKGTAQLHGAKLVLRRSAARALGKRLGVRIPRGVLGTLRLSAAAVLDRTPQAGEIGDEPPRLARPASAVDVTAGSIAWHVRDSWIRYVNSEQPPEVLEGAIAEAPIAENSHPCPDRPASTSPTLVYSYDFPFAEGWYDPASGTAALYGQGGVRFKYLGHGIDLTTRNPEIEFNGAASRAIFRLRGVGELSYPDKRTDLLALALSAPPAESPAGTFTYTAPIRGSLTTNGQAVFAGFYPPPNNAFGCFSVSFSIG